MVSSAVEVSHESARAAGRRKPPSHPARCSRCHPPHGKARRHCRTAGKRNQKTIPCSATNLHMGVVKAPVVNTWNGIHFLSHLREGFETLRKAVPVTFLFLSYMVPLPD